MFGCYSEREHTVSAVCIWRYKVVVHHVSIAIKWQISNNLVMFAWIEAHHRIRAAAASNLLVLLRNVQRGGWMSRLKRKKKFVFRMEWLKEKSKIILLNDQIKPFAHGQCEEQRGKAPKKTKRKMPWVFCYSVKKSRREMRQRAQINRFGYKTTFT